MITNTIGILQNGEKKNANDHKHKVLMPDLHAGCSLADSCLAEKLAGYLKENPGLYVVSYVNCTAAVKALSDVICTSGNG